MNPALLLALAIPTLRPDRPHVHLNPEAVRTTGLALTPVTPGAPPIRLDGSGLFLGDKRTCTWAPAGGDAGPALVLKTLDGKPCDAKPVLSWATGGDYGAPELWLEIAREDGPRLLAARGKATYAITRADAEKVGELRISAEAQRRDELARSKKALANPGYAAFRKAFQACLAAKQLEPCLEPLLGAKVALDADALEQFGAPDAKTVTGPHDVALAAARLAAFRAVLKQFVKAADAPRADDALQDVTIEAGDWQAALGPEGGRWCIQRIAWAAE